MNGEWLPAELDRLDAEGARGRRGATRRARWRDRRGRGCRRDRPGASWTAGRLRGRGAAACGSDPRERPAHVGRGAVLEEDVARGGLVAEGHGAVGGRQAARVRHATPGDRDSESARTWSRRFRPNSGTSAQRKTEPRHAPGGPPRAGSSGPPANARPGPGRSRQGIAPIDDLRRSALSRRSGPRTGRSIARRPGAPAPRGSEPAAPSTRHRAPRRGRARTSPSG